MTPWLSNYIKLRDRKDVHSQLYFLGVLSRGMLEFISDNKIRGEPRNERLCRFALASITKFADFKCLTNCKGILLDIQNCQKRLEGLI